MDIKDEEIFEKDARVFHKGLISRNSRLKILGDIELVTFQLLLKKRKRVFLICNELMQNLFPIYFLSGNLRKNLERIREGACFALIDYCYQYRIISWNNHIIRKKENIEKLHYDLVNKSINDLKSLKIKYLKTGMSYKPSFYLPFINLLIWSEKHIELSTNKFDDEYDYVCFIVTVNKIPPYSKD